MHWGKIGIKTKRSKEIWSKGSFDDPGPLLQIGSNSKTEHKLEETDIVSHMLKPRRVTYTPKFKFLPGKQFGYICRR